MDWKKIETWTNAIETISSFCDSYPQSSFSGLSHSLQQEWTHLCRVVENASSHFTVIEDKIVNLFIPNLFGVDRLPISRDILQLPVRYAGLGISNPSSPLYDPYTLSVNTTEYLSQSILNDTESIFAEHESHVNNTISEYKTGKNMLASEKLEKSWKTWKHWM